MRKTIFVLVMVILSVVTHSAFAGTIAAWGYDGYNQVSDAPTGNDFVAIAAGGYHGYALKANGSLAAWGKNDDGQCNVPAGNDFVYIGKGGGHHSLAIRADGSLAAWGENNFGQCDVPAGNDFVKVVGMGNNNVALRADGSLIGWGTNTYGECDVPAGNDFVDIAGDSHHGLAIRTDGSLTAWGLNDDGQCNVPAGNDFVDIGCAYGTYSFALRNDGSIVSWGGTGPSNASAPPTCNNFTAICSSCGYNGFALKSDGSIAGWGMDDYQVLSDIPGCKGFVEIASGCLSGLALTSETGVTPVADAGPDQRVTDADDNGSEQVTLDGSSSYDIGGTIVSWVWTDDLGDTIPDGEITTATLSAGTHTTTLTVTDDDGFTDTDTVTIIVKAFPYDCVAYYPFNGNANDESGNGNHGTLNGATLTADRFSNPYNAYLFEGTNEYIDMGDIEIVSGNTMAVSAWFKTTEDIPYAKAIVSKLSTGVAYHLGGSINSENKIQFTVNSGSNSGVSDSLLNDGQWHHVVGVYDGTLPSDNIKLYVDGVLQSQTSDYTDNIQDVTEHLMIGATSPGTSLAAGDCFDGVIDDVRIFDRALSEAEVIELYQITPIGQPPVANAGDDIVADANEEVVLDANESYDTDGHIVQYTWTAIPEDLILYSGQDSNFTTKALGRVEEVIKLTVTDNGMTSSEDTVSIFNRRVEDIELTPGPEGPQGPAGPQGPQGEQGTPGITPAEISQMQAQITALQQIVEENRLAMEQFNPLKKLLEELGSSQGILGDINHDGKVDSVDLAILTSNWLEGTQ